MHMESSSDPFRQRSRTWRPRIDQQLDHYSQFGEGCPDRLSEAIRYSLLAPGKRLRPMLVLLAAEACGSDPGPALPAACAVEMVHTYSLIHDDLPAMDDDALRRGKPTLHVAFDEATAILAGDALLARALEILASEMPADLAGRCCAELARAAGATQLVGGQADDLAAQGQGHHLEWLEAIHRRKTGAMLRVSLRLGGLVARASQQHLDALDEYGQGLGLAFQITDDLLDWEGRSDKVGKATGKDRGRGKLTYPGLLGPEASRERAGQLIDQACQALGHLPGPTGPLAALADFVLHRDR